MLHPRWGDAGEWQNHMGSQQGKASGLNGNARELVARVNTNHDGLSVDPGRFFEQAHLFGVEVIVDPCRFTRIYPYLAPCGTRLA